MWVVSCKNKRLMDASFCWTLFNTCIWVLLRCDRASLSCLLNSSSYLYFRAFCTLVIGFFFRQVPLKQMLSSSCQKWTADKLAIIALACPKEEQSMRQNGSLCSVIAGNLAEVTLATQTWFSHWERGETVAVTTRPLRRLYPRAKALSFVFSSAISTLSTGVIIVMQAGLFVSQGPVDLHYKRAALST